jgi:hypothetical protein
LINAALHITDANDYVTMKNIANMIAIGNGGNDEISISDNQFQVIVGDAATIHLIDAFGVTTSHPASITTSNGLTSQLQSLITNGCDDSSIFTCNDILKGSTITNGRTIMTGSVGSDVIQSRGALSSVLCGDDCVYSCKLFSLTNVTPQLCSAFLNDESLYIVVVANSTVSISSLMSVHNKGRNDNITCTSDSENGSTFIIGDSGDDRILTQFTFTSSIVTLADCGTALFTSLPSHPSLHVPFLQLTQLIGTSHQLLSSQMTNNDVIDVNTFDNAIVIGGHHNDTIHLSHGHQAIVCGDDCHIAAASANGVITQVTSISNQLLVGGSDSIDTSENVAITLTIGGIANDSISSGFGDDVIVGDSAVASLTTCTTSWPSLITIGFVSSVGSTNILIGGDDVITTNDGHDLVIAGIGNDIIYGMTDFHCALPL